MSTYSLSHLDDGVLLRDLAALVARDRTTTAALLAHLAEVDARKLYLPAGYPSMYAYCVEKLGLSEQAALKRIRVARLARELPAIFPALADGRLNLGTISLLSSHLTEGSADDLLVAAMNKSKAEIERLLAERYPQPHVPTLLSELSPGRVDRPAAAGMDDAWQSAARPVELSAPGRTEASASRSKAVALAPQRYSFQFTMSQEFHDKLRYAQELTSHRVHRGDPVVVLERAVDAYIVECERRRFARTTRPRRGRVSARTRHVPAHVRRAVWARDGGQCTFVGDDGHRCKAREPLEFDHIVPVARGGQATVDGIRLRCRGHNQFEAERTFGAEFMKHKRDEARRAQEARRAAKEEARVQAVAEAEARRAARGLARAQAAAAAEARRAEDEARARVRERIDEVIPWLRQLGVRADAARRAAERADASPDAPLEARVRAALAFHARARFPGCVGSGERRSAASIAASAPCPG